MHAHSQKREFQSLLQVWIIIWSKSELLFKLDQQFLDFSSFPSFFSGEIYWEYLGIETT